MSHDHRHIYLYFSEKACSHPDLSNPTITNGSLEINGKRQGGPQVNLLPIGLGNDNIHKSNL